MDNTIQPGDIVQIAGGKLIYEVIRIDGPWAVIRTMWGTAHTTLLACKLERMCDESVPQCGDRSMS